MTVAAIILAATPESALADADGMPAVRRIADIAWSGGATPIVVVAADPEGAVAAALAGAPVTLAEPAPREAGPVGQIRRGIDVASAAVHETGASLVWPARIVWVGPETVTSMIEASGTNPGSIIVPTYGGERGWPALVPAERRGALASIASDRMPDDVLDDLVAAGAPELRLELGDPGTTHDRSVPRADLPAYTGPIEPAGGHVHEWGAMMADQADDSPLEGPALAPYGQAAGEDSEQPG